MGATAGDWEGRIAGSGWIESKEPRPTGALFTSKMFGSFEHCFFINHVLQPSPLTIRCRAVPQHHDSVYIQQSVPKLSLLDYLKTRVPAIRAEPLASKFNSFKIASCLRNYASSTPTAIIQYNMLPILPNP